MSQNTQNINAKKGAVPVKNRTTYITELFEALPNVKGFNYSTEQLWEFFNEACKDKNINLRKLSEKKGDKNDAESGPKRITGYNLFVQEFKEEKPDGVDFMTHKSAAWKALSVEERTKFTDRATEKNKSNGYEPKAKRVSYEQQLDEFYDKLDQWIIENPETRGPKPERPEKKKRSKKSDISSDGSEISD